MVEGRLWRWLIMVGGRLWRWLIVVGWQAMEMVNCGRMAGYGDG